MNEELKVTIKVDSAAAQAALSQVRSSLNDIKLRSAAVGAAVTVAIGSAI